MPRSVSALCTPVLLAGFLAAGPALAAAPLPEAAPGVQPAGEASAAVEPVRAGASLRLATWNLYWLDGAPGSGTVRRTPADYERLRGYAEELDADIVALQEVDGEAAAARVFDPERYRFHFTADGNNRQKTGFAWKRHLDVEPQPDLQDLAVSRTRRGADILVRLDGRGIRLLSVHLKSGCFQDPLDGGRRACGVLSRQLPILERWIDARAAEGEPFVVLGDFNRRFLPGDTFWPELDDHDPAEADLTAVTMERVSRCWDGKYPVFIDHIILSRTADAWLVPDSFRQLLYRPEDAGSRRVLSDHCPVEVTLQVPAVEP